MYNLRIVDPMFDALAGIMGHCTVSCIPWSQAVDEALDNLIGDGIECTITPATDDEVAYMTMVRKMRAQRRDA